LLVHVKLFNNQGIHENNANNATNLARGNYAAVGKQYRYNAASAINPNQDNAVVQ
jgi:hypothetical protein